MNINKLRGRMAEMQISAVELAQQMHINPATMYRKMKSNGAKFNIGEIEAMKEILKMDDKTAVEILLGLNSH